MEEKKVVEFWKVMVRIKFIKNWDVVLRKRMEFVCKGEEKQSIVQENSTNL